MPRVNLPYISPDLIESYKGDLQSFASPATTKRKMSSLRHFFDWAEKEGHIENNPLSQVSSKIPDTRYQIPSSRYKILNTRNVLRVSLAIGMAVLIFLLLKKVKLPIPFRPAPAEEIAVVPTPTPEPAVPTEFDIATIIAQVRQEVLKEISSDIEWASFESGNLLIGGANVSSIAVSTSDGSDGDITINPDGVGSANFLFEGTSGNFLDAQNANLSSGSLIHGRVANGNTGYNLLELESGSTPTTQFAVDALGNTEVGGLLDAADGIATNNTIRLTSAGNLSNITGYSQISGNFSINQKAGETATISKINTTALSDLMVLTLDERPKPANPNSSYSTLVLRRYDGAPEAAALYVDNGNAIFDEQILLGRYLSNPVNGIGEGSLIYNTTDNTVYVWDGASWTTVSGSSAFSDITSGTNTQAAMVVGTGASLTYSGTGTINATTLNSIADTSFLRSDTSDNFTSGTLTTDAGTTLDVNGDLSVADTNVAFDGATTTFTTTGDLTFTIGGGDLVLNDTNTVNIGGSGSDVAYNVIGDSVTGASVNVDSDDDLYIEGNLEVDGVVYGNGSGLTAVNADTLDSLDSSQFLRSDTSDNFTSGTLTTDAGTTLDVNGELTITDTNIAFDGVTTTFTTTGDLTIDSGGGQVFFADTDTLNIGGLTNVAYNAFANSTDAPDEAAITADNDLYIGGDLEVDGTIYGNVAGSAGSVAWNDITNPAADLSLSMAAYNTTFSWDPGADAAETNFALAIDGEDTTGTGDQDQVLLSLSQSNNGVDVDEAADALLTLANNDLNDPVNDAVRFDAGGAGIDFADGIDFSAANLNREIVLENGEAIIGQSADTITFEDDDGTDYATLTAAALTVTGDLAITGGNITTAVTADSTLTVTGTLTANGTFDANSEVTIADTNVVFDGATTTFTTTGDLTIDSGGGQVLFADTDTLNVGGLTNVAYNALANAADAPDEAAIAADNDLYIGGDLEVDGTIYGIISGTIPWNELDNPTGDLTLTMAAFNTTFNWDPGADAAETNFSLTTQGEDTTGTGDQDQVLLSLSQTSNSVDVDQAADALLTFANNDLNDPVVSAIRFDAGAAGTDFTYGINFDAAVIGTAELIFQNAETIANTVDGTLAITAPTTSLSGDLTISGGNINTGDIALVVGDATTDSITLTTDGTGNAEVILPNDAIGPNEVFTTGQTDEFCLTYEATGTTWEWQICGGGGAPAWSSITNPTDNLTLTMAAFNTTFNWDPGPDAAETNFSLTTQGEDTTGTGDQDQVLLSLSQTSNSVDVDEAADALLTLVNADADDPVNDAIRFDAGGAGVDFADGIDFSLANLNREIVLENGEAIIGQVADTITFEDDDGTDYATLTATALTVTGDLAITGGNITTAVTADSTLTVTGTLTANGTFDANSDVTIADTNVVFDGATTTFTTTGDLTIDSGGGQVLFADADTLNIGGLVNVAYNALANAGEAPEEAAISSDNDLYIGGDLEVDGTIYGTAITASAIAWDDITSPTADLTLTMAAYNTTFNWDPGPDAAETNFSLTTQGEDTTGTGDQDQVLLALSQTNNAVDVDQAADALLTLTNNDLNDPVGSAIRFDAGAAGTDFTYGINFDAASIGTAELLLSNAATIANTVDGTLVLTEPTIQLAASTAIDIDSPSINLATQATDIELADGTASALTISEGANNYLAITTSNGTETLQLGNAATNPAYSFLGTGAVTIAGSADGTDALILTLGDILVSNGDVDISGGDFNVTLDAGDGVNIAKGAAPTADVVSINGGTSATDGVDALQLTFTADDASGNLIDLSPIFTDNDAGNSAETWNVIDIDALTVTQNDSGGAITGTVRGLNIGNLTESATGDDAITSAGINIGTGWDYGINTQSPVLIDKDTADAIADVLTLDIGTLTNGVDGVNLNLNVTGDTGNDADTFTGITIDAANNATDQVTDDNIYGLNIGNLGGTPLAGNEFAIRVGTGWDDILNYNGTTVIDGDGSIVATVVGGLTQGSVAFAGAGGTLAQDNTNFFWDDTNNFLGIGTNSPGAQLTIGANAETHSLAGSDVLISSDLEIDGTLYLDGGSIANSAGTATVIFSATPITTANTLSGTNWFVENAANVGQAALMVNQTKAGDLFTASASGTTRFLVANNGTVTITTTNDAATSSLTVSDASGTGTGKINVGTVDPPYTINGEQYATYLTSMVGVKEEVTGSVPVNEHIPGIGYRNVIDFNSLPEGSDLWLFGKTTNIKENIENMVALLTPSTSTRTWYEVDKDNAKLAIYSARPTNISFRLTAPRFDHEKWANTRNEDGVTGFIINDTDQENLNPFLSTIYGFSDFVIENIEDGYSVLKDSSDQTIDGIEAIGNFIAANIKAGTIETEKLAVNSFYAFQGTIDNLLISTKLVSPVTQTALISPLPDEGDITIQIGQVTGSNPVSGKLAIENALNEEVASIDSEGNSEFAGNVNSQSLIADSATITGELRTNKVYADEIVNEQLSSITNQLSTINNQGSGITREEIEQILSEVEESQSLLSEAANWSVNTATSSGQLDSLATSELYVTDTAAINSLSVSSSISIGPDLVLQSSQSTINNQQLTINSIDTLTSPLSLQSLALAPVEIMAGKVRIETNGDVFIEGNVFIAGNLEAEQATFKGLAFKGQDGNETASIDASGSAQFASVETGKFIVAGGESTSTINTEGEIETNALAGTAELTAGQAEITIRNPNIGNGTLVYVTPTSSTQNKVLYVKTKGEGFFTAGLTDSISDPVTFNWWIIDVLQNTEDNPTP